MRGSHDAARNPTTRTTTNGARHGPNAPRPTAPSAPNHRDGRRGEDAGAPGPPCSRRQGRDTADTGVGHPGSVRCGLSSDSLTRGQTGSRGRPALALGHPSPPSAQGQPQLRSPCCTPPSPSPVPRPHPVPRRCRREPAVPARTGREELSIPDAKRRAGGHARGPAPGLWVLGIRRLRHQLGLCSRPGRPRLSRELAHRPPSTGRRARTGACGGRRGCRRL